MCFYSQWVPVAVLKQGPEFFWQTKRWGLSLSPLLGSGQICDCFNQQSRAEVRLGVKGSICWNAHSRALSHVRSPNVRRQTCWQDGQATETDIELTVPAEPSLWAIPAQAPGLWVNKLTISVPFHWVTPSFRSSSWGPGHYRAKTSCPCCSLSEFLSHRIHEHNKWLLFCTTELGKVCYVAMELEQLLT